MLLSFSWACIIVLLRLSVTSSIEGKDIKDFKEYDIVFPVRVTSDDKILDSNKIDERYKRSSRGQDDIKHYKFKLRGIEETIDLRPNARLLAPAAIIEVRSNNKSDLSQLSDISIKQFSDKQCIYTGKVRNYDDSLTALSTCGGLYGLIRIKKHTYFIEPVEDKYLANLSLQPHIIYEASKEKPFKPNCATKSNHCSSSKQEGEFLRPSGHLVKRDEEAQINKSKPLYMETMVALDKTMMDLHSKNDLADYVLTVLNIAQSLLHDLSIHPPINLELVRMVELEDDNHKLNQKKKRAASEHLKTFSAWQNLINPKSDNHPYHHDLALLLTGNNICNAKDKCNFLGVAETNGICDSNRQAALCKDNGLTLGYTVAHEIAHTLGLIHDTEKGNKLTIENTTVMNPVISQNSRNWSPNSQHLFQSSLEGGSLNCLYDEQPPGLINPNDILPGIIYGRSFQCKRLFNENAVQCDSKEDCASLKCKFETTPCTNTGVLPAPGTSCGENKWCLDGECIEIGKYLKPVQGDWSSWSEWSPCSRTCGAGVSTATRECNNPSPKHGGKTCKGRKKRHKMCSQETCPKNSPSFRDAQCAAFNDWIFPEDGKTHEWKGFFIANGDPCNLVCENEDNLVVSLQPKVKDGTSCNRGLRDVCVEGVCESIPCDLQFNSDSIEDGCGVCHGNGTTCEVQQGTKNFTTAGVKKCLPSIPTGTKNIKLEMEQPVNSHFIVKSEEGDHLFNLGINLGKFEVPGGIGWLGMNQPNQELLEIPGPITQPLTIWISAKEPQSVSYSMGLPSPLREGKYSWKYSEWLPCNAQCGDGIQYSEPKCFEKSSGLVENEYCVNSEKPTVKSKPCNAGPCIARWQIGEWNECGPCPSDKAKRFRLVRCVKPISGEDEGDMVVTSEDCPGNRPNSSEICNCVNKRQAGFWPPRYKSHSPMAESMHLDKKSNQLHEKRITLMQLENESEASMLKQFKENQFKHNPLMYIPTLLGRRINKSSKRKKRTAAYGDLSKMFQSQKLLEACNSDQNMKKTNGSALDDTAFDQTRDQSKLNDMDELKRFMQDEFHDDVSNNIPLIYKTPVLDGQNLYAISTQKNNQDLNFSDSVFKLLQQNKPLNNPQEKKDGNFRENLQEPSLDLSFLNNPKNIDDMIHIMTLLKALQYANTSQSASNPEYNLNTVQNSNVNNFMKMCNHNIKRKEQFNNSFQKHNMIEQEKSSSLKGNYLNSTSYLIDPSGDQSEKFVGSHYNMGSPFRLYENDKVNEAAKKEDYNSFFGNRIVVFPTDEKLVNKNKQQRTAYLSFNNSGIPNDTNKCIVQKIISNLKYMDYNDKLKLYNDLCNITEALRGLLSFKPDVLNYPNKLESSLDIRKPLIPLSRSQETIPLSPNKNMFKVSKKIPELNYQNNVKIPLMSNSFYKIQNDTPNECFDKFMQSMKTNFNQNKINNQFSPPLEKRDSMMGNKPRDTFYQSNFQMGNSFKFSSKPVKRNYPIFFLTSIEPITDLWQLEEYNNLKGATIDNRGNIVGDAITFSYKIPNERVCTTGKPITTSRGEKCVGTVRPCRQLQQSVQPLVSFVAQDEPNHIQYQTGRYTFGKRPILNRTLNQNTKMYILDLKKPEMLIDLMDLINHNPLTDITRPPIHCGSKQGSPPLISLQPKNETCILLNELQEVFHRNCTGCYYIYKEETTKPQECIITPCREVKV